MKRIFLFLGLFFPLTSLYAEIDIPVKFGIKGGANFNSAYDIKFSNNIKHSYNSTFDNSTGFHAGLWGEIGLGSSPVGIQPELLFSRKLFKFKNDKGSGEIKTNYIDIPLMVKYNATPFLYALAGPQYSVKLSNEISGSSDFKSITSNVLNSSGDWGASVGLGLKLWNIGVEVRNTWGISNLESRNMRFKNRMFQLSLICNII